MESQSCSSLSFFHLEDADRKVQQKRPEVAMTGEAASGDGQKVTEEVGSVQASNRVRLNLRPMTLWTVPGSKMSVPSLSTTIDLFVIPMKCC